MKTKKTRKLSLKRTRLPDGQPAGHIEITIKGTTRIGKSIMAQLIARALEPVYKNVKVVDGAHHGNSSIVHKPYAAFAKELIRLYDGEKYPRVLGVDILTKEVKGEISGWHQVETDRNAKMKNGVIYSPVATFVSSIGGGGRAQIIRSSGFYKVAYRVPGDKYEFSENIIPEFLDVMAKLEKERKKV